MREKEQFDGKFILTTNIDFSAERMASTNKNPLQIEVSSRNLKDILETRPIYFQTTENRKRYVQLFGAFPSINDQEEIEGKGRTLTLERNNSGYTWSPSTKVDD